MSGASCQKRFRRNIKSFNIIFVPITAWRYSDLNHHRQETLAQLFATCGFPLDAVESALAAFEDDSQAGTVMARGEEHQGNPVRLNSEQEEEIRALVRCHPIIQTTDFVAPSSKARLGR